MQSYRTEGYGRISLLSFLTHYMLYLDIQHLKTYASPPTATTTAYSKTKKNSTLGILTHQAGTSNRTRHNHGIKCTSNQTDIPAGIFTHPRSSRRTLRLQPTPATCTTQCSCRRTRFRSTQGTPRSRTTYRILPITRSRAYLRDGIGRITSCEKGRSGTNS
jgi:hypothetical protein